MPFCLHTILMVISSFIGTIFGLFIGLFVNVYFQQYLEKELKVLLEPSSLITMIVLIIFFFAGHLIPIHIFKNFIPTKCSRCKSRSVICYLSSPTGSGETITYHCKSCGYLYETPVSISIGIG